MRGQAFRNVDWRVVSARASGLGRWVWEGLEGEVLVMGTGLVGDDVVRYW